MHTGYKIARSKLTKWTKLVHLCSMAMLILASCSLPWGKQATPTPLAGTPQAIPTPAIPDSGLDVLDDGRPLPPRLVAISPAGGVGLEVDGAIQITFDQAMDAESTARAWEMRDTAGNRIAGEITWVTPQEMRFQPQEALLEDSLYFATISTEAKSTEGIPLSEPLSLEFVTMGALSVSQVFPSDGAADIANNAVITVIFNRPVVPLTIAEEQAGLPQPLEFSPAVEGEGEWVNTSVYAFRPSRPLKSGTTYQVTIQAGLQDAAQKTTMSESYTWSFQTAPASLLALELSSGARNPKDGLRDVLLGEYFTLVFQQPMDVESTEANLNLTSSTDEIVTFETAWNEDWTRLVITPTQLLDLNTSYLLRLDEAAQTTDGGRLQNGLMWHFTTIPAPGVLYSEPANNQVQTNFSRFFRIKFASPMNLESVKAHIVVSPTPDEEIQWWYNEWDWSLSAFFLQPSTRYEIRLLAGAEDIYGNAIPEDTVIRFTTAPYSPSAFFQMPYDVSVFRATSTQEFYVQYQNVSAITLSLYRLSMEEFIHIIEGEVNPWEYRPGRDDLIWEFTQSSTAGLNELVLERHSLLPPDGSPLQPGYYFLTLDFPEFTEPRPFADTRVVVLANANLTFKSSATDGLLWVTDLDSGLPLQNVPLRVYNEDLQSIGQGKTNDQGWLYMSLPEPEEDYASRFALTQSEEVFAFASSQWGSGVNLWDYGLWGSYYAPARPIVGYVYTERPIYRPGQPVYFKGILRVDDDVRYSLPKQARVHVTISSYKDKVYETDLPLTDFGTFSGQFTLDEDATLGEYTLTLSLPGMEDESVGYVYFNVAEYRKPEFQVKVSAEPQNLFIGDEFSILVKAEYYSGGGVAEAEVNWRLVAEPFIFDPPKKYSGYSFEDIERDVFYSPEFYPSESEVIASGTGRTDERGEFHLTLPANLEQLDKSKRLIFEADVLDISKNMVSGRTEITAHRSAVYPGVRAASYVGLEGQEERFLLVALDWEGKPIAGQLLDVEIVERRWYSVQEQDASGSIRWTSTVEDIPIIEFEDVVTDAQGETQVSFTPPNGGIFRARITTQDTTGRIARASAYMWVAGKEYIPWRQTNDRSFDLITDQESYAPGDTAKVLIASPFQGEAYALITVERGHILYKEVIHLVSNSTQYELPIRKEMAPNAYISVLVVKGIDDTNLLPTFKMGVTEIMVDTLEQEIDVQLSAEPQTAGPGDQVSFTVRTRDSAGNPIPAEVSLSLSDLATLSLMPPNAPPLLDFFYSERSLGVWSSVPLVLSIESYNASVIQALQPEGGGLGSGGGKGSGVYGVVEVRQEFPDTAYWEGHLETDANGEAVVVVTLPDNLTTWRMDARAVTKDTRVGQTTLDIISSKPLLVRPQTPRFFVAQDQVRLGCVVQNNTTQDLSNVEVHLESSGLRLLSEATQSVDLPAGSQVLVTWDATVEENVERVDLVFSARNGELQDASRPPMGSLDNQGIPVYRYEAPESVATSGMMTAEGTSIEAIQLPYGMEVQQGELRLVLSPSLAAGLQDGLRFLKHFPFECAEQTVSRFLPSVIAFEAFKEVELPELGEENRLQDEVNTALQRLYNSQNADGGWGWWKGDQSDINTSAYVTLGLIETRRAGYAVDEQVLARALRFLRGSLVTLPDLPDPAKANRQAFILYVLARGDKADVSRSVRLYELRQQLALYARAYLMHTLYLIDNQDARIETLRSDLLSAAITSATGSHWEEGERDIWNWNTDTRTTAIILHALAEIAPQDPINANAVRWLMSHRQKGYWVSTQETAWAIMALSRWAALSGELQADYDYALALNGKRLGGGVANAETLDQNLELTVQVSELLTDQLNRLAIGRSAGPGNLYYTAHLKLALPVERLTSLERGIIVSRSYYYPEDLERPITQASLGELILARLTLIAPATLHHVIVEDPLPAGLEAVDQSLSTSPQTIEVPQQYTWEDIFWKGWGWWHFDHVQKYDEKVVLSADLLPAGTYIYTYLVRAATIGVFKTLPPTAFEFYFPEVYGRGEGMIFTVTP